MKKILNLIKNPKVKMVIILSFLIFIYTSICAFSYAKTISKELSDSVFRLHVIANSDSTEDQNLKYMVRDNLISYMNTICKNCSNKEEAINLVSENISNFQKIAEDTISKNGFDYSVNIEIGNFEFPTKTYGDISFPAGYYDALKTNSGPSMGNEKSYLQMSGKEVFKIATSKMPEVSLEAIKKANLSPSDVNWLVPHQANVRIIDAALKKISIPAENTAMTISEHANTSAASIPLAFDNFIKNNKIKHGDVILMTAMGAGFTWGSVVLRY